MNNYRQISENKILHFPATPGFKGWKQYFTKESVTHPAKANLRLLTWILKTFTEEGETVLDPMAGTGSTVILAALLGRDGVAVELEGKFCDMIRGNIALTEVQQTLTPKGRMMCIQGDARELSRLLGKADVVVTSPPYQHRGSVYEGLGERMKRLYGEGKVSKEVWGHFKGRKAYFEEAAKPYSSTKVDAIVTSPPYSESMNAKNPVSTWSEEAKRKWWKNYRSQGGGMDYESFVKHQERQQYSYSDSPDQIGSLKHGDIDVVVTSPPYGEAESRDRNKFQDGYVADMMSRSYLKSKTEEPENIGNLKGATYLEAMLQIYRECWRVLKPSGHLILIVKNFIRNKAIVRLDLDTIRLCEAAEFRLTDRWYFKLPTKSFWRVLYQKKYPDVPTINYEDILIFEKA